MPVNWGESSQASTVLFNVACTYICVWFGVCRFTMAPLRLLSDQLMVQKSHGASVTTVV